MSKSRDTSKVLAELASYALRISPQLGGTPTAPTAPTTTNNTQIATTEFVKQVAATTAANSLTTTNNYQVNSLGVGTPASGVTGEIRATNEITAYYSDERLKTVISNIQGALAALQTLDGVMYTANEEAAKYGYTDKKVQVGLLAQQVQAVCPQVVVPAPFDIGKNADGTEYSLSGQNYLTIHYERMIPLLVEAIKELAERVESLENK